MGNENKISKQSIDQANQSIHFFVWWCLREVNLITSDQLNQMRNSDTLLTYCEVVTFHNLAITLSVFPQLSNNFGNEVETITVVHYSSLVNIGVAVEYLKCCKH